MQTLVSVDFHAQFGFLKKPDINKSMYMTYNMLHKPVLLGILGAISGLKGYNVEGRMKQKDVPQFREKLVSLEIAIQPLKDDGGNFIKDIIRYTNTVGYSNIDKDKAPCTLLIDEQTLINPSYRVHLLLDDANELHGLLRKRLQESEAEYIPYLGKNDHQLWWNEYTEWGFERYKPNNAYRVSSIFLKTQVLKGMEEFASLDGSFMYFERLPVGFQKDLPHYDLQEFAYTDFELSSAVQMEGLLKLSDGTVIQVF